MPCDETLIFSRGNFKTNILRTGFRFLLKAVFVFKNIWLPALFLRGCFCCVALRLSVCSLCSFFYQLRFAKNAITVSKKAVVKQDQNSVFMADF
jgi:hypothetical protein